MLVATRRPAPASCSASEPTIAGSSGRGVAAPLWRARRPAVRGGRGCRRWRTAAVRGRRVRPSRRAAQIGGAAQRVGGDLCLDNEEFCAPPGAANSRCSSCCRCGRACCRSPGGGQRWRDAGSVAHAVRGRAALRARPPASLAGSGRFQRARPPERHDGRRLCRAAAPWRRRLGSALRDAESARRARCWRRRCATTASTKAAAAGSAEACAAVLAAHHARSAARSRRARRPVGLPPTTAAAAPSTAQRADGARVAQRERRRGDAIHHRFNAWSHGKFKRRADTLDLPPRSRVSARSSPPRSPRASAAPSSSASRRRRCPSAMAAASRRTGCSGRRRRRDGRRRRRRDAGVPRPPILLGAPTARRCRRVTAPRSAAG